MTDLNKEREAFEYWADAKCYYLDKRDDGHYEKGSTALAWEIAQYFMAVGRAQELEKAKAQAVPDVYVLFPKTPTKEINEILGMQCFQFIRTAQIYRELGFEIKKKAESEQAFFLFKFLHLALVHGDKYLDVFNAETRKLIESSESGAEG